MFESNGPDCCPGDDGDSAPAAPRPVDYMVSRDGKPFLLLNAAPNLAANTVNGLRLADPQSDWTWRRC